MDTDETTQYANPSEARGLPKAAAFVLECLNKLPQAFQVALGQPMLLQPFTEVTKTPLSCMYWRPSCQRLISAIGQMVKL